MKWGHRSHVNHRETVLRGKFVRPLNPRFVKGMVKNESDKTKGTTSCRRSDHSA
jgi:hypothetical protein